MENCPILLVEDDDVDTEFFMRALKKSNTQNPFFRACDGVEALDFIEGQNGKEKIDAPRVMFLDINMPRMNGFELLEQMKKNGSLGQNKVFMLTTSARPQDIETANSYRVSGYLIKESVLNLENFLKDLFKTATLSSS